MKSTEKLAKLKVNIGRRCVITESAIAGLTGQSGEICEVVGNDVDGYRYVVELVKPLFSFTTQTTYYPPVFLCDIKKIKTINLNFKL